MRVLIVDPGQQVPYYDRALAAGLSGHGHDVFLDTAPLLYDTVPDPAGVAIRQVFGRLLGSPSARRLGLARRPALRRFVRALSYPLDLRSLVGRAARERPDVVHLQWSLAPPMDAFAMHRLRSAGLPVAYTVHNVLPHERRPWHAAAYRSLYAAADALLVHSEATRENLTLFAGNSPLQTSVVA